MTAKHLYWQLFNIFNMKMLKDFGSNMIIGYNKEILYKLKCHIDIL